MNFENWWRSKYPTDIDEVGFSLIREGWDAATKAEREKCANVLSLSRSDALLMAGEMTSQEWRTVSAVLKALQTRMRSAC